MRVQVADKESHLEEEHAGVPHGRAAAEERDGDYFGPPEDSAAAVRELEALRSDGAGTIIFAWPALWWLDYYREFAAHLRGRRDAARSLPERAPPGAPRVVRRVSA